MTDYPDEVLEAAARAALAVLRPHRDITDPWEELPPYKRVVWLDSQRAALAAADEASGKRIEI